jgi:hypothetical protein
MLPDDPLWYKDAIIYEVHVRAFHDSVGFKPVAKISWTENGQERVKLWMEWAFERSFAKYKDAEREAYIFAKDWVDSNRTVTLELKK